MPLQPSFKKCSRDAPRAWSFENDSAEGGRNAKRIPNPKDIRDRITDTIKPYINETLLPQIEKNFGFKTQHKLGLKLNVDAQDIGEWILNNLQLGFQLTDDENVTLALSEAGSGVQSGVLSGAAPTRAAGR